MSASSVSFMSCRTNVLKSNELLHSANLKVIDLTEEDIAELKTINKTAPFRAYPPDWAGWGNLGFPDC